jgi:hypothetical protein
MTGDENLPLPFFLFSMFLNDLEDYFKNVAGCPLKIVKEKLEANLHTFIEIFVLLYADDTNIFRINGGYAISTKYISVIL